MLTGILSGIGLDVLLSAGLGALLANDTCRSYVFQLLTYLFSALVPPQIIWLMDVAVNAMVSPFADYLSQFDWVVDGHLPAEILNLLNVLGSLVDIILPFDTFRAGIIALVTLKLGFATVHFVMWAVKFIKMAIIAILEIIPF